MQWPQHNTCATLVNSLLIWTIFDSPLEFILTSVPLYSLPPPSLLPPSLPPSLLPPSLLPPPSHPPSSPPALRQATMPLVCTRLWRAQIGRRELSWLPPSILAPSLGWASFSTSSSGGSTPPEPWVIISDDIIVMWLIIASTLYLWFGERRNPYPVFCPMNRASVYCNVVRSYK